MASVLLDAVTAPARLLADKAYDADAFRDLLKARKVETAAARTADRYARPPALRRGSNRSAATPHVHGIRIKLTRRVRGHGAKCACSFFAASSFACGHIGDRSVDLARTLNALQKRVPPRCNDLRAVECRLPDSPSTQRC
jgi:hypothetical protein